ncbi:hypothetical protein [Syntrophomonas erecta]
MKDQYNISDTPIGWLWDIGLIFTLGLLFPFYIISQLPTIEWSLEAVLAYSILFYGTIRLTMLGAYGKEKLLSLTFWIFVYVWLGIVPLGQVLSNITPWSAINPAGIITLSLLVVVIGLVFFDIGYKLGISNKGLAKQRIILFLDTRRMVLFSVLTIVVSLIIITRFYGGFSTFLMTRTEISMLLANKYSKTQILLIGHFLVASIYVAYIAGLVKLNNAQSLGNNLKAITIIIFFLITILICICSNPVASARYQVGFVGLSTMFVIFKWNDRQSMKLWIMSLLILLLVIFPYADLFRSTKDINIDYQGVANELTKNGDYDAFKQLANTVEYVENEGSTKGNQALGVLFFFVPRTVWGDKPLGTGEFVAEYMGYDYTNLSAPLWAEAYINGGLIGVILAFICYGFIIGLLEKVYLEKKTKSSFVTVFVPFFAGYQLFFLRGDIMSTFAYLVPILGFMLIVTKCKSYQNILGGENVGKI